MLLITRKCDNFDALQLEAARRYATHFFRFNWNTRVQLAGRGGLVVGRPTTVREDPGSNLAAAGRVYHDSHCDIQPWVRVVHPYCSA